MKLFNDISLYEVRSTTTFRLATLLGVLFCCGVVALGGLIYGLTTRELTARTDQILRGEANRLLRLPPTNLASQIPADVQRDTHGLDKFALLSPEGRFITGNIAPGPGLILDGPADAPAETGQVPMRVLEVRAGNGSIILLGRDINEIRYLERHILIVIVVSCLSIIPAVLLIGTSLSFRPLRRLHVLQETAKRVAIGQFNLRMPYAGKDDELDQIAMTVNAMIEDVGRIMDQVKNVTDAVAHDLRTPLARVRSQIDDLRSKSSPKGEHFDAFGDLIADLDIVLARFAALLRISELEARERLSGFSAVALKPLVGDIFELYYPLAEDAGIQLRISQAESIQVYADRSLLFEAVSNLVDNAIKFGESKVSISIWRDGNYHLIKVQDDGAGIPENEREAVLKRFYRLPGKPHPPGSGLGLSVVAAILHLHRFKLELGDAKPGLSAKILMPIEGEGA